MAFKKGVSGNVAGRPIGQTPGAQIRKAIEQHSEEILQSVINSAVNGDMSAAKMLLDRITPSLKPIAQQISLALPDGASLSEQGSEVVKGALMGAIPSDIGVQLLAALGAQAKIIEIDDLAKRVAVLESRT